MGRPYTQHGSRHGPNGSDPILGLASASGLSWAYQASPSAVTIGTATNAIVAPQTATGFFTNDSAAFSQGSEIHGGNTYYGIQVDASSGFYLTLAWLTPFGAITVGVEYSIDIANSNDPDEAGNRLFATRRVALATDAVDMQTLSWALLGTQDYGSGASGPMLFKAININSIASYQAKIEILCLQLDPTQSSWVG